MVPSPDKHTLEGIIEKVLFKTHEKLGSTTTIKFESQVGVAYIKDIRGTLPFVVGNKVRVSYTYERDGDVFLPIIDTIDMYSKDGVHQFKIDEIAPSTPLIADIGRLYSKPLQLPRSE